MITLEFDDLPLMIDGRNLAGTALIGSVGVDYDVTGDGWLIEEILLCAAAKGKPDLVLQRHKATPLFWDLCASIEDHLAPQLEAQVPRQQSYADEHRLRQHELR